MNEKDQQISRAQEASFLHLTRQEKNNYSIFLHEKKIQKKKKQWMDWLPSTAGVILHASNYTDATHNSLANLITPLFFFFKN
jgi:hypothetical protein